MSGPLFGESPPPPLVRRWLVHPAQREPRPNYIPQPRPRTVARSHPPPRLAAPSRPLSCALSVAISHYQPPPVSTQGIAPRSLHGEHQPQHPPLIPPRLRLTCRPTVASHMNVAGFAH